MDGCALNNVNFAYPRPDKFALLLNAEHSRLTYIQSLCRFQEACYPSSNLFPSPSPLLDLRPIAADAEGITDVRRLKIIRRWLLPIVRCIILAECINNEFDTRIMQRHMVHVFVCRLVSGEQSRYVLLSEGDNSFLQ